MSYWTVKRKAKKIINSLEDNLPVNPKPAAGADVIHASNCDDSNTVESMDSEDNTSISENNYESDSLSGTLTTL